MIAPPDPDASLVDRCEQFVRSNRDLDRQQRIVDVLSFGEARDEAQDVLDDLAAENVRLLDLIQTMPAFTYAGRMARARACGEQWKHGLPDGFELVAAVLADSLAA